MYIHMWHILCVEHSGSCWNKMEQVDWLGKVELPVFQNAVDCVHVQMPGPSLSFYRRVSGPKNRRNNHKLAWNFHLKRFTGSYVDDPTVNWMWLNETSWKVDVAAPVQLLLHYVSCRFPIFRTISSIMVQKTKMPFSSFFWLFSPFCGRLSPFFSASSLFWLLTLFMLFSLLFAEKAMDGSSSSSSWMFSSVHWSKL